MSQILEALPDCRNYKRFLATRPSLTFTKRSESSIRRKIRWSAPGELLRAHLVFDEKYARWLKERNYVHYFIYRDPRDVVVSEAHYLTAMNHWHRLHKYFAALDSMEERISFSILGNRYMDLPYDYPDIASRFQRYEGWIKDDRVCSVRFEELLSNAESIIKEMMRFYAQRAETEVDVDGSVSQAIQNITPEKSHTYRKGGSGGWQEEFTEQNKKDFKEVAGELLIRLGYAPDLDW